MSLRSEINLEVPIAEDAIYKPTANSDLVVERHLKLFCDRFYTYHSKDPSVRRSYYFDRACELIPKNANDIFCKKKSVRAPGSWTITATVKRGCKKVSVYEVTVKWPLSWAPKGYTTFTLGVESQERAKLWHKRFEACLLYLTDGQRQAAIYAVLSGNEELRSPVAQAEVLEGASAASPPRLAEISEVAERAIQPGTVPHSQSLADDPTRFQDDGDHAFKDADSECEAEPHTFTTKKNPQRWVPYKHTNGVAIYRHEERKGCNGGEYMASSVVRGPPRACLNMLVDPTSNTTILGPATDIEVIQPKTETNPREVLRIRVEAQGLFGKICAPRDMTVERFVRVDDSGLFVILFNTVEPVETQQTKLRSPRSQSWYRNAVNARVNGGFTIAPLDGYDLDSSPESLVTIVLRVDPGGCCSDSSMFGSWSGAFGMTEAFVERMLMSVILIKDEVEHSKFKVQPFTVISTNSGWHSYVNGPDSSDAPSDPSYKAAAYHAHKAAQPSGSQPSRLSCSADTRTLTEAAHRALQEAHETDEFEEGQPLTQEQRFRLGTCDPKYFEILHVDGHDSPFRVRGPTYLRDRVKVPAGNPEFSMCSIDVIALDNGPVEHLARFLPSVRCNGAPFSFVINLFIPGTPLIGLVYTFTSDRPPKAGTPPHHPMEEDHDWAPFDFVLHRFLNGTTQQKNRMLKLIPHIADGSWVIKQSVGTTPVIVGTKLKTSYHQTQRYIEMDIDVSANATAAYVTGMVRNTVKNLVIDFGFVLEGTAPWELPESLAGAFRLHHLDITTAKRIDMSSEIPMTASIQSPSSSAGLVRRHSHSDIGPQSRLGSISRVVHRPTHSLQVPSV